MSRAQPGGVRLDLIVAILLAAVLSLGWALLDWPRLSHLLLPDTDDMMRLAQVRDWLGGQGTNDWTQYRVAPPMGAPMHWSRVNDFGIAAIILAATPFVGRHSAELIAVLTYPGLLFACAIFLSARIGRRLWGPAAGPVAAILTGLAYPGTTVFIPGRIDHHALQVVLIQLFVLLLMRAPSVAGGIAAGVVAGTSLVIGLETAPQLVALLVVLFVLSVARGPEERKRLAGFSGGLGGVTLFFLLFLRPTYWTAAYCDAFTPASSTAMLAGATALGVLAAATPWLRDWRWRFGAGAMLGAVALGGTLLAFPVCVSGPYGKMDPFLLHSYLPFIEEANGVFALHDVARAISFAGLLVASCAAAVWMLARARPRWAVTLPIAAVVGVSALVMLAQVRGAYIGAPLGAPILAGLVLAARGRASWQLPAVVGAWLASAGLVYLQLPKMIEQALAPAAPAAAAEAPQLACSSGDAWEAIDRFPPGVTMASVSTAAYLIGATHHSTVGAGYHRNNAGNMAMYRFFLSPPDRSRDIARGWKANYVLFCLGDFAEIQVTSRYPASLAAQLQAGRPPAWLQPLPLAGTRLRLYRIAP